MNCLDINYYFIYILLFLFPLIYLVVLRQTKKNKLIELFGKSVGENTARILFFIVFIMLWILPYIVFEFCDLQQIDKSSGRFFW